MRNRNTSMGVLALCLVLLSLTACQSVQTRQVDSAAAGPSPQVSKPQQQRRTLVVRSEVVPDEPAIAPARKSAQPQALASSITPPAPDEPAVVDEAAGLTSSVAEPTPAEAPAADAATATAGPTPLVPPASDPQPGEAGAPAPAFDPGALLKDPAGTLRTTTVAGMPLWLVVAFGALAIISLVIGFSGPREQESRDEPAFA